jgi:DUF4097 and DUF4098 domain-containing protein YvlB
VESDVKEYVFDETFLDISLTTDTADVIILPADDGKTKILCHEQEHITHTVSITDGVLTIEVEDTRAWYEYVGITTVDLSIEIYLPEPTYNMLRIRTDTGDITLPGDSRSFSKAELQTDTGDVDFGAQFTESLNITTDTGEVTVRNANTNGAISITSRTGDVLLERVNTQNANVAVRTTTGDVELNSVRAYRAATYTNTGEIAWNDVVLQERALLGSTTGDITIKQSDAARLSIETDTGDVKGWLLTDKIYVGKSGTGRVSFPATMTGGHCEVYSNTGDIIMY